MADEAFHIRQVVGHYGYFDKDTLAPRHSRSRSVLIFSLDSLKSFDDCAREDIFDRNRH